MNLNKLAQQDARRWAAAEMFYGEGAGTRRKHLSAEIESKYSIPGYFEAFDDAYNRLDMNKYAADAIKERKRIDRSKKVDRNLRGLMTGNRQSLTTGVGIAIIAWGIAKQTGADEDIKREAKKQYANAKAKYNEARIWVKVKRAERKLKSNPS